MAPERTEAGRSPSVDTLPGVPLQLLVLRHGHAQHEPPPGGDDFARPLRPRGRRALGELAPTVQALDPGLVLSSPSRRTRETVECLELSAPVDYQEPLYAGDADELLDAVRELSARDHPPDTVLLVGHNPGVHQLVLELTGGEQLPGFPAVRTRRPDARRRPVGRRRYRRCPADVPAPAGRSGRLTAQAPRGDRSVSSVSQVVGPVRRPHLSSTPAPLLVVGSVVSVQIGGALAKHVIDDVGPAAATSLRLLFAAIVLGVLWRPRIPRNGIAPDPVVRGHPRAR